MNKTIAIPKRYDVVRQDLSRPDLKLDIVGYVRNIEEARTMCKVLRETDKEAIKGNATYLFVCSQFEGG